MKKTHVKSIPVVILPGWKLPASRFAPLVNKLKKRGFRVLCPDLPGFGKVELTRALTLTDYAEYVVNYIYKNVYKKVILIGHSFGGRVGILLATTRPELIKGLVLTGIPTLKTEPTVKRLLFLLAAKIGKSFFQLPVVSMFGPLARKVLYKLSGTWDYYHTSGFLKETFINTVSFNLEPYLPKITVPTLVLWGEEDLIVPRPLGFKMAKLIPGAQWVSVAKAGHSLPYQAPEKFVDEVEKFLKAVYG